METTGEKKLIGMRQVVSLADNRTGELWKRFMPRRGEVGNGRGPELYSLQVYEPGYFEDFRPEKAFEQWAALEVTGFSAVPAGMETFTLAQGLYAVFHYTGPAGDAAVFRYIFTVWLPAAPYRLDNRPHFERLGAKYKNNDPTSEEEIWIPVRPK